MRDHTTLVFFDLGARVNSFTPNLASRLRIRVEEMGPMGEAGLACPSNSEAVSPITGKPRVHIQSYVDMEEFHIMPLEGCDVLLGMPWCHRLHAAVDTFNKKITFVHRGKTHLVDVKLKDDGLAFSHLQVTRGGKRIKTVIFELVVGDIVHLGIGDQIPGDGLLVKGNTLIVDESSMTGESEPAVKDATHPFLISGCKVLDGTGSQMKMGDTLQTHKSYIVLQAEKQLQQVPPKDEEAPGFSNNPVGKATY
ncbi:hypothetical protein L7F22_015247 [Adiantum nelumboides]|nr:hypothetical protein [Adiantum nelumboides]